MSWVTLNSACVGMGVKAPNREDITHKPQCSPITALMCVCSGAQGWWGQAGEGPGSALRRHSQWEFSGIHPQEQGGTSPHRWEAARFPLGLLASRGGRLGPRPLVTPPWSRPLATPPGRHCASKGSLWPLSREGTPAQGYPGSGGRHTLSKPVPTSAQVGHAAWNPAGRPPALPGQVQRERRWGWVHRPHGRARHRP